MPITVIIETDDEDNVVVPLRDALTGLTDAVPGASVIATTASGTILFNHQ